MTLDEWLTAPDGSPIRILQAPIGGSATVDLVAEVGRGGGIGGFGFTWATPERAVAQIRALKARRAARFFANYVLRFPQPSLSAVIEEGVPAVTLSWGVDAGLIAQIRTRGTLVGVQVGHPDGGRRAVEAGADFLIAQESEAGGHVQATLPLVRVLAGLREVVPSTPVIAAGGLSTGADIAAVLRQGAAVLRQGAAAAMLGTRFLATPEADAHELHKAGLVTAKAGDTAFTNCFDVDWPYAMVRVLRNRTLDLWEAAGCPASPHRPGEGEVIAHQSGGPIIRYSDTPPLRDATGEVMEAALYAGTSVDGVDAVLPAFDVMQRLRAELAAA